MLSKETIERIEKDAIDYINPIGYKSFHPVIKKSYVTGATAEATRYEKELKELRADFNELMKWEKGFWNYEAAKERIESTLLKYK